MSELLIKTASNMSQESIKRSIVTLNDIADKDDNTTFINLMALEASVILKQELLSRNLTALDDESPKSPNQES